jgi:hypothetical protein
VDVSRQTLRVLGKRMADESTLTKQEKRGRRYQQQERARIRRTQVYAAKLAGHTFEAIGRQFGVSTAMAKKDWLKERNALRDLDREPVIEMKETWRQRQELLWRSLAPKVVQGDVKAIHVAVQPVERVCRMLGLDEPLSMMARVDVRTDWTAIADDLARRYTLPELRVLEADAKRRLNAGTPAETIDVTPAAAGRRPQDAHARLSRPKPCRR